MLLNSLKFLIFFPVVTLLYFVLSHRNRWWMLLIASCIFYMIFIPKYNVILAGTIGIDNVAGIWLEKPGFSIGESAMSSGQAGTRLQSC